MVLVVAWLLAAGPATATSQSNPDGTQQGPDAILVVADAETGRTLLGLPVENGTEVSLNYTHSVEKTQVIDTYTVRGDRLVMTRMEFSSFGAGLPSRADVNRTDEGTYAFDPPGAYEEFYVQPGRIAGHQLRVGDQTFDLVELSNASSVRIHLADCEASNSSETATNVTTASSAEGKA